MNIKKISQILENSGFNYYLIKGKILVFGFLLLAFVWAPTPAAAHRFHTSLTRMDFNSETKSLEISIQLFTHDIIEVFEKRRRKKNDIQEKEEIDKLIFEYLKENFVLKSKDGQSAKMKWVGKEVKVDLTWVFLEIPLPENLEEAKLQNTIFFETYQEQTNHVIYRFEQKKTDLLFKIGDKFRAINFFGG